MILVMGRWKGWALIGVSVVVALGAVVWLWRIFSRPGVTHSDIIGFWALIVAVFTALFKGLKAVWGARRPANPRSVDTLADLLALAVRGQWRKEAIERVLVTPPPIPVGWSLSDLPVAGPIGAAVGDPGVAPAFPPLPGQTRVTEAQLGAGGGRGELFAVYAGIASGRMVVLGARGAGKTGTAILLLLDALEHRDRVDDKDRARVPVPVLFTAHGWDPATCSVQDWLAARLAASYPLFQHRGGQAEAAALVADGAVALFLDGLDEMDVARRPAALQALSDAPFQVVVLTRNQEMVQAAGAVWLVGAVAVKLHPVTGPEGADYLQHARTGPAPAGWTHLLTHLRENPDGALAQGLSTPLALTLIRDTYRAGDDISKLLDTAQCSTADDVEQHLIARVLPDAYTPRPGRPAPHYSLIQAQQALSFLARRMNQDHTRDLAWWNIPRWTPTTPRILANLLVVALLGEFVVSLSFVVLPELAGLKDALTFGLVFGLPIAFLAWFAGRLTTRVASRLAASVAVGLGHGLPERGASAMNWRAFRSRPVLLVALAVGLAPGLAVGLFAPDPTNDLGAGLKFSALVFGLSIAFVVWLVVASAVGFSGTGTAEGSPLGPRGSWRHDRRGGLAGGLVFGIAGGLAFGLLGWLGSSPPSDPDQLIALVIGLVFGLAFWVAAGVPFWLGASRTWQTTLAWVQLQRSHRVPSVGLMPFLEDARARGVLRTVGAVYQFRHATLQDQLSGQTTVSRATSSSSSAA